MATTNDRLLAESAALIADPLTGVLATFADWDAYVEDAMEGAFEISIPRRDQSGGETVFHLFRIADDEKPLVRAMVAIIRDDPYAADSATRLIARAKAAISQ